MTGSKGKPPPQMPFKRLIEASGHITATSRAHDAFVDCCDRRVHPVTPCLPSDLVLVFVLSHHLLGQLVGIPRHSKLCIRRCSQLSRLPSRPSPMSPLSQVSAYLRTSHIRGDYGDYIFTAVCSRIAWVCHLFALWRAYPRGQSFRDVLLLP